MVGLEVRQVNEGWEVGGVSIGQLTKNPDYTLIIGSQAPSVILITDDLFRVP
jgi:hypothetical protein